MPWAGKAVLLLFFLFGVYFPHAALVSEGFRRVRKMAKVAIGFVMSVLPYGATRLPLDGFS